LLAVPAALLGLALLARDPIENALGVSTNTGEKIVFSYWNKLPHWLLIGFFTFFGLLALLAVIVGVARFWRAMEAADSWDRVAAPARRLGSSIVATLKTVLAHNHFSKCATERPRLLSHLCAFYGFIALSVVAIRVLMLAATARFNPLIQDFAYPFNFWNPWRMLANLGGVALVVGCLLMIRDRLARSGQAASTFFDWALPGILLAVALTGFLSEGLHYARMEPQRQGVYFVHLVFVFALLAHLPYSKFAHLTYRTAAMVYGEYSGRNAAATAAASSKPEGEKEARQQAQPTNRQPS
jgi:quinone-modifying oxidoreductase subunit QmoC